MPVRIDSQIVSKETGPEDAYNNQLLSSKIQRQSDLEIPRDNIIWQAFSEWRGARLHFQF